MSLQTQLDSLLLKILRNDRHSAFMRARFRRNYGTEIGLETIGAFDRWRIPPGTRIGRYCSIAKTAMIIDANHPMSMLSTHPVFYLKSLNVVDHDAVVAEPTVLEDDVWLGHYSIITPECKKIGRGAVVGAGATVMQDVPPYAVVAGSPAKLVRRRFSPGVIEAIEATRWWELDAEALRAASLQAPGFLTNPTIDGAQAFLRALGRPAFVPGVSHDAVEPIAGKPIGEAEAMALLREEMPDLRPDDLGASLRDLDIDSFGLINLRLLLERAAGAQISDARWSRIETPRDLIDLVSGASAAAASTPSIKVADVRAPVVEAPQIPADARGPSERRAYSLNMPQMALQGLSEAWLFKELGDIHWSLITRGLGASSASISDDTGSRLYATFTRFQIDSRLPLTSFRENDDFTIEMSASRLGAGMFFGEAAVVAPAASLSARVMTSFSKFGEHGANTSLLKGQPRIPADCPIPPLEEMPAFGLEYRELRARPRPAPLFECEYVIQPPHDINGVGLLYFAAYPMIADLCAIQKGGARVSTEFSTTKRDVFYFANCSPEETIVYQVKRWDEGPDDLIVEATLKRKSDDVQMAYVATHKARVRGCAAERLVSAA